MKRKAIRIVVSTMLLLMAVLSPAVAITYKLVKVTSVEAGKMYVFEQSGRVMNDTIQDSGISSTNAYSSTNLSGNESYIWILVADDNNYKIKNIKKDKYLHIKSNSNTFLELSDTGTPWVFTFQNDETVYVTYSYEDSGPKTRFLAYAGSTEATSFYRAYIDTESNLNSSPHKIAVYQLVEETSEDVTLSAAGMATYVSTHDLDYSSVEGLKAYRAKFDGYAITFTSVTQVPANEGVLLKATETLTASTNYTVPFAAEAVAAWADDYNDFICGTGANVPTEADGHYNYILNKVGEVVGFYKANNKKVAANRAYLSTTTPPPSSSAAIGLAFEDETTGMRNLTPTLSEGEGAVYNLNGQRVNSATKGLYIINGKKVVIK